MVRLPPNKKQTYRLNSRPQMWLSPLTLAMTLTLIFQGQICNLLYLSPKWSDCHETKSKHIDWTLGLKCDHQVWLWPWAWPWIFKVKYGICYTYLNKKKVRLPRNEKQTYQMNPRPQMLPIGLTLAMTLIFEFSRSNVTYAFDHTHGVAQGFSWSNFEIAVFQNGMANWHWTNGVGVGHSWPWLWPFGDQGQVKGSTV